ncbi:hypothetical protein ISF_01012 [Cordyceps fumosorosea ARSEF 2679]|uniref:Uncharacterized protein n=1 Tax=Cordyceps fumosorosea (strain ARSEF 2679) TaxID=1081104 RepID=A0A168EQX1_CORFA|nr:hypothetical protein ISF_01012 [Cordyceps fumosorosea ARSEF 2679]OAA74111.1 hypothetical protein ISF_01012 [Cordyceps fumosorosea ARSEF 2679]
MDAAALRDGLRTKLDHLEAKLESHRQDLLAEFHKHYDSLTRTAGPFIVASVQDELRAMLDDYKELRPNIPQHQHQHLPPSPPQPAAAAPKEAESPPPRQPPVSDSSSETAATTSQTLSLASKPADAGTSSGAPDSPRDRDHELHGLFTPTYLPLLAASPTPAANTPASPAATTKAAAAAAITSQPLSVEAGSPRSADTRWLPAMSTTTTTSNGDGNGNGNDTTRTTMDQSAEEDRFPGRLTPPPRHRPSDSESANAAAADDANSSASDDKNDNKAPRSALRRSSSIYKSPQSPRRVRFEFMGAEVLPTASPQPSDSMMPRSSSPMWEGENVSVDSVLGGDAEDSGPPPKKISSSDALRALSREPLEDGTLWTVVNPDSDHVTKQIHRVDLNESSTTPESGMQQVQQDHADQADEINNNALGIKKTRATAPPPISKPPVIVSKGLPKNKAPNNHPDVRDDDDDMFHFEDEGGQTSSLQRPPPPADDGEHSEDETASSASARDLSTLRSPTTVAPAAVPSSKPSAPEAAATTTPTTPRFHIGSVGSYMGRSIMMPVVKSPEVHAKAASIGNFSSFVGGVDGTSGMDPADLSSYRASVMRDGFSGTPRSFTERLMMEDMEAERLKGKANQE